MYIDILILTLLLRGARYGYEIKKHAQFVLGNAMPINNNALYPSLRRLEKLGAVAKTIEEQSGKPDRHLYKPTPKGKKLRGQMLGEFTPVQAKNNAEFFIRVVFFDDIAPALRSHILATRSQILRDRLRFFDDVTPNVSTDQYDGEVLSFNRQQTLRELEWIEKLDNEERRNG